MNQAALIVTVLLGVTVGLWSGQAMGNTEGGATVQNPGSVRVELKVDRENGQWWATVTSLSDSFQEIKVDAAWKPTDKFNGPVRIAEMSRASLGGRVVTRDGGVITGERVDTDSPEAFFRDRYVMGLAPGDVVTVTGRIEPCDAADLDGDGKVNAQDIARCLGAWGATGLAADINRDGVVDAKDLAALLAGIEASSSPPPADPPAPDAEPAS